MLKTAHLQPIAALMKWCTYDDHREVCALGKAQSRLSLPSVARGAFVVSATLLAAGATHADSRFTSDTAGAPVAASAHLDFRITVLPSIALRVDGQALTASGSLGWIVLRTGSPHRADSDVPNVLAALRGAGSREVTAATNDALGRRVYTIVAP